MPDPNYQARVYGKQGAGETVIASGGQLTQESGGIQNWQAGGLFYIGSRAAAYYSENFGAMMDADFNLSYIMNSQGAGSGVFSVISLGSTPMHYILYGPSIMTNASLQLPSANTLGGMLYIDAKRMQSAASLVVYASGGGISGVSITTALGSAVSSITMCVGANGNQNPYLIVVCNTLGVWSVADYSCGTLPRAAA